MFPYTRGVKCVCLEFSNFGELVKFLFWQSLGYLINIINEKSSSNEHLQLAEKRPWLWTGFLLIEKALTILSAKILCFDLIILPSWKFPTVIKRPEKSPLWDPFHFGYLKSKVLLSTSWLGHPAPVLRVNTPFDRRTGSWSKLGHCLKGCTTLLVMPSEWLCLILIK